MEKVIAYTSVDEQIAKLKSQNLFFLDEEVARENLRLFGYSNVIKSYRDPYILKNGSVHTYRDGVTFEQIFSLYILDKNLRNAVMASMQDLEEHIKEVAADVVANSFGIDQNKYLQYKNYANKKKRKKRFCLPAILDTLRKTLETDKNPIHHYAAKYGSVPPWILFKSIYFSTIVNFIDLFKASEQEEMVQRLYDLEELNLELDNLRKLMMDTLFICIDYRNMAAHGGRIYNYSSKNRLRMDEIFNSGVNANICGFNELLFLLSRFRYKSPFKRLEQALQHELTRHCRRFPEDVTYLGQILNVNIVQHEVVYVSSSSNKYHISPHCSGIKDAIKVEFKDAKQRGLVPCKRCYKD
jgi:abortive infection bacteriophage resistance protein